MEGPEAAAERLERCFAEIAAQRMAGVPILNAALRVKALGTRDWQGFWLSILVTPWFLNVMLQPQAAETETLAVGVKRLFSLPAGPFEFIRGHEPSVGGYWMCSLFSPVLEFTDQEAAEATATAALEALFAEDDASEAEPDMAMIWRGELPAPEALDEVPEAAAAPEERPDPAGVSRRALLRGRASTAQPPAGESQT